MVGYTYMAVRKLLLDVHKSHPSHFQVIIKGHMGIPSPFMPLIPVLLLFYQQLHGFYK